MKLFSGFFAGLGATTFLLSSSASALDHSLANKEHLNIYFNEHVTDIGQTMENSDLLTLLYITSSEKTFDERSGQDWTMLDNLFLQVLTDL